MVTAIPPTLVALGALLQSRHNDAQAQGRATTQLVKTAEIHELTNSNLTMVKAQLSAALARIDQLETTLKLYAENHPGSPHVSS